MFRNERQIPRGRKSVLLEGAKLLNLELVVLCNFVKQLIGLPNDYRWQKSNRNGCSINLIHSFNYLV